MNLSLLYIVKRVNKLMIVVFPDPVGPTKAIVSPGCALRLTSLKSFYFLRSQMKHSQVQHALVNFVQRMRLFILNFWYLIHNFKTRSPPATAA